MSATHNLSDFGIALGDAVRIEHGRHRRRQRVAMVASVVLVVIGVGSMAALGINRAQQPNVADGAPSQPVVASVDDATTEPSPSPDSPAVDEAERGRSDDTPGKTAAVDADEAVEDSEADSSGRESESGADGSEATPGQDGPSGASDSEAKESDAANSGAGGSGAGSSGAAGSGPGVGEEPTAGSGGAGSGAEPDAGTPAPSGGTQTPSLPPPPPPPPPPSSPTCGTSTSYLAMNTILGGGITPGQLGPMSIWGETSAGVRAEVTTTPDRGLAVSGGRYDYQIDFDASAGASERLTLALPADVCRLSLLLNSLANDGGLDETGNWTAYNDKWVSVGRGRISADLSTPAAGARIDRFDFTFDVPPSTAYLVISASGYNHGQGVSPDDNNSDFAIEAIDLTILD